MKYCFSFMFFMALALYANAQQVPSWMNELPRAENETYMYVRESGEGRTAAEAQNEALARVMQSTAMRIGQPFDGQKVNEALSGGTAVEVVSAFFRIPINKVDQYEMVLNDGTYRYRVYVLCQVAVAGNVQPEWTALRREGESNDWTALAKSAVVPGLGQMGKGYGLSGALTLTGEVLLVGAGIGCYYMAQDKLDIMRDAATPYDDYIAARDGYNRLRTASCVVWTVAGVLYAYNLVRAFTMQPRRATAVAVYPGVSQSPSATIPTLNLMLRF